ncbi:MAG: hypothetical protein U5M53_01750 [Rhodoferax sp.]|nr:hypothetical protein [Rhodoferax sp.]
MSKTLAVLLLALTALLAQATQSTRDQEIAQCLPGEITTWGDGRDRTAVSAELIFVYDHGAAPPWFSKAQVLQALAKAATAWSQCGVPAKVVAASGSAEVSKDAVQVQWSDEASQRNFGLANLTTKTLALGPSAFQLLKTRNPAYDSGETLQMVISHEMGHLFGVVAHSKRCVDVSSYYRNNRGESCFIRNGEQLPPGVEYRASLPTACDIQRCRAANATGALH